MRARRAKQSPHCEPEGRSNPLIASPKGEAIPVLVPILDVLLTATSWFILGLWFGMGYCPLTDWKWEVKEQLGETGLPPSFITYYAEKISGREVSDKLIEILTGVVFAIAAVLSVYFNFFRKRKNTIEGSEL